MSIPPYPLSQDFVYDAGTVAQLQGEILKNMANSQDFNHEKRQLSAYLWHSIIYTHAYHQLFNFAKITGTGNVIINMNLHSCWFYNAVINHKVTGQA